MSRWKKSASTFFRRDSQIESKTERTGFFQENFVVEQDFDVRDAVLQEEEVSQIKWVTVSQLKQMASKKEFYRYPEFFDVVRFLEERRRRQSSMNKVKKHNNE